MMQTLFKSTSSPIIVTVPGPAVTSIVPSILDLVIAGNGTAGTEYKPRLVNSVVNVLPVTGTIIDGDPTSILNLVVAGQGGTGTEYKPRLVSPIINALPVNANDFLHNQKISDTSIAVNETRSAIVSPVKADVRMPINSGNHTDVMINFSGNGTTIMPRVTSSTFIEGQIAFNSVTKSLVKDIMVAVPSDVSVNVTGHRNINVANTTRTLAIPNALINSKLIMHPETSVFALKLDGIAAVSIPANVSVNATGYRNINVANTTRTLAIPNALTNSTLIMHPAAAVLSLAPIATGGSASGQRSQVHSVKFGTMVSLLLTKDETEPTLIASTVTNMPPGFSLSSDSKSLTGLVAFTGTLSVGVTYSDDSTQTHYLESFIYDILNGS